MQLRELRDGTEMNITYFLHMAYESLFQGIKDKVDTETGEPLSHEKAMEALLEIAKEGIASGDIYVLQAQLIIKSLGQKSAYQAAILYFQQALIAQEQGQIDLAWSYLCDTFYLVGFFNGSINTLSPSYLDRKVDKSEDFFLIEEDFKGAVRSQNGKKGGDSTKNKNSSRLIEPVFSLLEKLKPPNKIWSSADSAAAFLYNYVQDLAKDEKAELPWYKERTERSIADAIRKYPDRFAKINRKEV
jgi:hypothetical protein